MTNAARWGGAVDELFAQDFTLHDSSRPVCTAKPLGRSVSRSQQVDWWEVCLWAAPFLDSVDSWPMVGTPEWCSLPMDDRRRWAAVIDAGRYWAQRVESCQVAECAASSAISESAGYHDDGTPITWGEVAQRLRHQREFEAEHPWARRSV